MQKEGCRQRSRHSEDAERGGEGARIDGIGDQPVGENGEGAPHEGRTQPVDASPAALPGREPPCAHESRKHERQIQPEDGPPSKPLGDHPTPRGPDERSGLRGRCNRAKPHEALLGGKLIHHDGHGNGYDAPPSNRLNRPRQNDPFEGGSKRDHHASDHEQDQGGREDPGVAEHIRDSPHDRQGHEVPQQVPVHDP